MSLCLNVVVAREGPRLYANITRKEPFGLSISTSVVCSISKDKYGREVFMVKEGVFLLVDGKTFTVVTDYEL